jgi:hypothetical protein
MPSAAVDSSGAAVLLAMDPSGQLAVNSQVAAGGDAAFGGWSLVGG